MRPIGGWENRTHCKWDHEFTPENTRSDKRGFRICKQCVRTRTLRYRAKPGVLERIKLDQKQRRQKVKAQEVNPGAKLQTTGKDEFHGSNCNQAL